MKKIIPIILTLIFLAAIGGAIAVSAKTKTARVNPRSLAIQKKPTAKTGTKEKTLATATTTDAIASSATSTSGIKKGPIEPKATPKKPAAVAKKNPGGIKWAASGLASVRRIPSGVRPAYMRKVESYAKRNGITTITATVVSGMRE